MNTRLTFAFSLTNVPTYRIVCTTSRVKVEVQFPIKKHHQRQTNSSIKIGAKVNKNWCIWNKMWKYAVLNFLLTYTTTYDNLCAMSFLSVKH